MEKRSSTSQQARQLSSGTIASLIMRNRYDVIDHAQAEFVGFIDRMDAACGRAAYGTWQDAWAAFRQTGRAYDVMLAA
jgi:hypothetical protein